MGSVFIVYCLILPLCMSEHNSLINNRELVIYKYMQQLLLLITVVILSFLLKSYVEVEYRELITTLDRKPFYLEVLSIYLLIQIILSPFYLILIWIEPKVTIYILMFLYQTLIIFSCYYFIAMTIKSSFIALGLTLGYILLFSLILSDISLINIFQINKSYKDISTFYYIKYLVISIILINICEKKNNYNLYKKHGRKK